MADIFISYSRKDLSEASSLADALRSSGFKVWMDIQRIQAATSWGAEIADALEQCSAYIILLSNNSLGSANVAKELSIAATLAKQIIPVRLDDVTLKGDFLYHLNNIQHVYATNIDAIVRALGSNEPPLQEPVHSDEHDSGEIRIAVLPFEDQSPAHDNEWFSDGLTDELISTLNALDALFVLDRNSSKIYRDAKLTTVQIARALGVRYVVSGAVRKAGEKIRIRASLIDGRSGALVWDEKFDGAMNDIFEIQEATARDIVKRLKIKLTPEEEILLAQNQTKSPEAYALYLQGRLKNNDDNDPESAIALFKQAFSIDPQFLPALEFLSICYSNAYRKYGKSEKQWLELSKEALDQIIALDPNSYYQFGAAANYYMNIGDHKRAIEQARHGVDRQPKSWGSYTVLGFVAYSFQDFETTVFAYERAFEIDPNAISSVIALFFALDALGREDRLLQIWNRVKPLFITNLVLYPDNIWWRALFMNSAELAGEHDLALKLADEILEKQMPNPYFEYVVSGIYARNGRRDDAVRCLRSAIDRGWKHFVQLDVGWFENLEKTDEYRFLLDHVITWN